MPERYMCTTLAKKALYKYSSFPFLFLNALLHMQFAYPSARTESLQINVLETKSTVSNQWKGKLEKSVDNCWMSERGERAVRRSCIAQCKEIQ